MIAGFPGHPAAAVWLRHQHGSAQPRTPPSQTLPALRIPSNLCMDMAHSPDHRKLSQQAGSAAGTGAPCAQGKISVGILIPPDFERRLQQTGPSRGPAAHRWLRHRGAGRSGPACTMAKCEDLALQRPAARRCRNPHLLQPGAAFTCEHGSRPGRHHPDHDHDPVHGGGHRAGA